MAFYKDEKTHVYSINADTKVPKARASAPPDLERAFAAGAMSGKGRGVDPTQPTVIVATGKKRAK